MDVQQKKGEWWEPKAKELIKWENVEINGVKCQRADLKDAMNRWRVRQKVGHELFEKIFCRYQEFLVQGRSKVEFRQEKFPVTIWSRCEPPKDQKGRLAWIHTFIGYSRQAEAMTKLTSVREVEIKLRALGMTDFKRGGDPDYMVCIKTDLTPDQIFKIALMPPCYNIF